MLQQSVQEIVIVDNVITVIVLVIIVLGALAGVALFLYGEEVIDAIRDVGVEKNKAKKAKIEAPRKELEARERLEQAQQETHRLNIRAQEAEIQRIEAESAYLTLQLEAGRNKSQSRQKNPISKN